MAAERILVVDDEPGVRAALEGILVDEGYEVVAVESGEAGVAAIERAPFDAVLLDIWLPGIDGLEALRRIREIRDDSEVIMISGHGTIETAVRATQLGAFDFVEKPLALEKTLLVLRNALRKRLLERRNRRLLEQLDRQTEILGRSRAAKSLRREIERAARVDTAVLIVGESGSGRETAARRIHAAGPHPHGPFVETCCAALHEGSLESVLFGTADGDGGRLRMAHGGTLFLEDADRLPPTVQDRLASALRTGPPRVIASARPGPIRLTPALRPMIDVLRVEVPSLRERREDLPLLVERFLSDLAREYGRPVKRIAPDCLRILKAHDWPGNLRELHSVMEGLVLGATADVVRVEDLPTDLGGTRRPGEDLYREFGSLDEGLRTFERYYVARVLSEESGDREAAARRLGLTHEELARRLGGARR